jgi:hypothetical protein
MTLGQAVDSRHIIKFQRPICSDAQSRRTPATRALIGADVGV